MNTTLNLEQLLFLPCLWLVCSRYSSENAAFFSLSGNEADTYPSGCFSLPWCHTSIRKASSRLCWSPQRLQARVQIKASGMAAFFPEIFFPNEPDASKAHKAEARRSKVQIKNAPFRQRLPLLSALMSSRSVRGRENQLLPTEKKAVIRTLDGKRKPNCRKLKTEKLNLQGWFNSENMNANQMKSSSSACTTWMINRFQ